MGALSGSGKEVHVSESFPVGFVPPDPEESNE